MEWFAVVEEFNDPPMFFRIGADGKDVTEQVVFVGTANECMIKQDELGKHRYDGEGNFRPDASRYSIKRVYLSFSPSS